jgi:hypothetical protein
MHHTVLKTKEYILYFEYILKDKKEDIIVVHNDVYKWNKKIQKELLQKFLYIFSVQELPLFCVIKDSNKKLQKFAKLNGFYLYEKDVTLENGEIADMYKWIGSK